MKARDIARIFHSGLLEYTHSIEECYLLPWEQTDESIKEQGTYFVNLHMLNPNITIEIHHNLWYARKIQHGWSWGTVYSLRDKKNPLLVPFESLPKNQQIKADIFVSTVRLYRGYFKPRTPKNTNSEKHNQLKIFHNCNIKYVAETIRQKL